MSGEESRVALVERKRNRAVGGCQSCGGTVRWQRRKVKERTDPVSLWMTGNLVVGERRLSSTAHAGLLHPGSCWSPAKGWSTRGREIQNHQHPMESTARKARGTDPTDERKAAPMVDIKCPTCCAGETTPGGHKRVMQVQGFIADTTVTEGHEGCAWGRRVGNGGLPALSSLGASVPDAGLDVRACIHSGEGTRKKRGSRASCCCKVVRG